MTDLALRVLEDDPQLRSLLRRGLDKAGFATTATGTAADLLAAVASRPADLLVVDIGLPDADGRDVVQALRAAGHDTPVPFLTARDALADRLSGFAAGADDYLTKPFALAEVVVRLLSPVIESACRYAQTAVRVDLTTSADAVAVNVSDDGPGVGGNGVDRLFEPGARGAASSAHTDGAGLGLALARRLARSAGGDASVASRRKGRGSRSRSLPRSPATGDENGYRHHVATAWHEQVERGLESAGLRRGGARRAVVDHLARQHCCLSAQEIHEGLREDGVRVGIASVYRVLDTLTELRLVQRVDFGDGVARFEPVEADGHHHHHVVCDDCGKVEPFEDDRLEHALSEVASRLGWAMDGHEVVLHGACGACRAA